jgi:hypothetical protein
MKNKQKLSLEYTDIFVISERKPLLLPVVYSDLQEARFWMCLGWLIQENQYLLSPSLGLVEFSPLVIIKDLHREGAVGVAVGPSYGWFTSEDLALLTARGLFSRQK